MLTWTPGVGDGQGGLACCGSWGHKELDMIERLNWTEHVKMLCLSNVSIGKLPAIIGLWCSPCTNLDQFWHGKRLINIYARIPEGFIIENTSDFREGDSHPPNSMRFSWRSCEPTKIYPNAPQAAQSCWLIHFQITALFYLLKNHASVSVSDAAGMTPLCDVTGVTWLNKEKLAHGASCSPTWKSQTGFGNTGFSTLRLLTSVFVHSSKQKVSAPLYWNGFPLFGESSSSSVVLSGKNGYLCATSELQLLMIMAITERAPLCHLCTAAPDDHGYHWRPYTKGKHQTQRHYFTALTLLKESY